jgi:3'(2'), 5'-bisphosphate nucleotidase
VLTPVDDHRSAYALAEEAGLELMRLRSQLSGESVPAPEAKDRGDQVSHDVLMASVAEQFPDDAVLSEEGADDLVRLNSGRVWIIDPLDGTREFSEYDRDDWAVHVALWEQGGLTAGAVALPARSVTYTTSSVAGEPLPERPANAPLRLAVSRSRPPAFVTTLAERLGAELVPMGSAGVKAMSILDGTSDAYVHAGGQYEWDSAAPVAVARAAGLHTSRIDGSPLVYNNANPWLPDLVVCRPEFAETILSAIAELGEA